MFYGRARSRPRAASSTPRPVTRRCSSIARPTQRVEWQATSGIPLGAVRGGALQGDARGSHRRARAGRSARPVHGRSERGVHARAASSSASSASRQVVLRARAAAVASALLAALMSSAVQRTGPAVGNPMDDETAMRGARTHRRWWRRCADGHAGACAGTTRIRSELFAEAETRGRRAVVARALRSLAGHRDAWIDSLPRSPATRRGAADHRLETALYEACANVVEHGLAGRTRRSRSTLWWVPRADGDGALPRGAATRACGAATSCCATAASRSAPGRWQRADLHDRRATWQRGRGFGLDIIHLAMERSRVPTRDRGRQRHAACRSILPRSGRHSGEASWLTRSRSLPDLRRGKAAVVRVSGPRSTRRRPPLLVERVIALTQPGRLIWCSIDRPRSTFLLVERRRRDHGADRAP